MSVRERWGLTSLLRKDLFIQLLGLRGVGGEEGVGLREEGGGGGGGGGGHFGESEANWFYAGMCDSGMDRGAIDSRRRTI